MAWIERMSVNVLKAKLVIQEKKIRDWQHVSIFGKINKWLFEKSQWIETGNNFRFAVFLFTVEHYSLTFFKRSPFPKIKVEGREKFKHALIENIIFDYEHSIRF